jgi:hypothetical protein
MDTMMVDKNITSMTSHAAATDTAVSNFSAQPVGAGTAVLSGYLRANPVTYAYCWTSTGVVTNKNATTSALLAAGGACA